MLLNDAAPGTSSNTVDLLDGQPLTRRAACVTLTVTLSDSYGDGW
jgi:hypothetical protein